MYQVAEDRKPRHEPIESPCVPRRIRSRNRVHTSMNDSASTEEEGSTAGGIRWQRGTKVGESKHFVEVQENGSGFEPHECGQVGFATRYATGIHEHSVWFAGKLEGTLGRRSQVEEREREREQNRVTVRRSNALRRREEKRGKAI